MTTSEADYILIGGGLTGCAVASRLKESNPSLDVLIIEAGKDPSDNPNTISPMGGFALAGSELDWAYQTVPQANTDYRKHTLVAGKTLGGGSILNYGGWARGDASDYDCWAKTVGDPRWSYHGLLPYMRKTEKFYNIKADREQHGFDGQIKVTSVLESDPKRRYPLCEPVKNAWIELGVKFNDNPCSGNLAGISEFLENWDNGIRQPAQLAYSLKGVQILTDAMVHRVLFSKNDTGDPAASEVLLADGRKFKARKEIIITAGSYRTPQILMLSGVGPAETLSKYGIPVVRENSAVGQNLFDHFALYQVWKLRNPEKGLALGSPLLTDPAFFKGLPSDWNVNEAVPLDKLKEALREDGAVDESLADPGRSHIETLVVYTAMAPGVPVDGTFITTSVMLLLPSSRGSISITSSSPTDPPAIDSNYYSTQTDRVSLIHGVRRVTQALTETSAGKGFIECEVPPPGMQPIEADSADGGIDARIRAAGIAHFHPTGGAAMGRVVDTNLKVIGVRGLRIADSSVLPVPLGGHPQATLYALAEQAAEIIIQEAK